MILMFVFGLLTGFTVGALSYRTTLNLWRERARRNTELLANRDEQLKILGEQLGRRGAIIEGYRLREEREKQLRELWARPQLRLAPKGE